MDALTISIIGALNIACFFIGAKIGQMVVKGKEIEFPNINPLEQYRQHQDRKQAEEEKNKLDTILRNIERYDGTSIGQEDVR